MNAPTVRATYLAMFLAVAVGPTAQAQTDPQGLLDHAIDSFFAGDIEESATSFDTLVARTPTVMPRLWQRGIVLYYAQRYDDCREQFESHRTVNPNDVENAAWHFLCVASSESPEHARAALLPVGPDPREPMEEIYGLFSGSQTAAEVMAAANGRVGAEFYAHLYVGLHAEAIGDHEEAVAHITEAAADKYAPVGGYMHTVARIHVSLYDGGR